MERNRICELLGIQYPIVQAPMSWVSGAALVAAVSNAGGLGTLGPNAGAEEITPDVALTAERTREQIRRVRRLTKAPFAVNVVVGFGDAIEYSRKIVEVLVEERVPAAVVSVGRPDIYTERLKNAGITVLHAVSTPRHAAKAEAAGVDAVICEGYEAGGHKGFTELTTLVLTPMIADRVRIPVIAGGGIGDARAILAALALGADGVYVGTRFMVTRESESHPRVKEAVVEGREACTISVPKAFMLARDLVNDFTKTYLQMKRDACSAEDLRHYLSAHSQFQSQHLGQVKAAEICCGQVAGMIDSIEDAARVVSDMVENLGQRLKELQDRLVGLI